MSGALLSVYLARQGHEVILYERRPDPRRGAPERGRSINLALSTRGIEALRGVGLDAEILRAAIPMRGRMIHPKSGPLAFQAYSRDPSLAINSVSRSELNALLLTAAERERGVTVRFGVRCLGVDPQTGRADVLEVATGERRTIETETVVGADGAFSGVRSNFPIRDRADYSQSYLEHGYKELTIPPAPGTGPGTGGTHRIEKNALHIWPRGTFMMIALPNADGSFTCTLFWPFEGPNSFSTMRSGREAAAFFEREFPDSIPLLPTLAEDWEHNPAGSLVTVKCRPWHVGSRAVLIGDAAHAVVPFYGQGMNASFEDCAVLARCIGEGGGNLASAYARYEALRRPNTDALADLAIENFIEMRDKVGSAAFRRKKRFEHLLETLLPNWYVSLYHMVSFTTIPYAEAVGRARRQERKIKRIVVVTLTALVLLLKITAVAVITHYVTRAVLSK